MTFSDPGDRGFEVGRNTNSESPLRTRMVALGEPLAALREVSGAQLVEFALALPLLLALLAGLLDFATAYNLRQKLNNAAREGARIATSQSMADLTQTTPPSVQVVRDAVVTYLNNAAVNTSFIGSTMTPAGGFAWTYYSSGAYGLKIERAVAVPATGGGTIISTRVTLNYPYNWSFGFNGIIGLLVPSASYPTTISIPTDATMQNLPS
jgi:Flp pilus assembly protein TadG